MHLSSNVPPLLHDTANHRIVVGITLELKEGEEKESELPYFLKVELAALFEVDESKFDKEHIYDWARRNAPFILFPYLREEAYALTIRAGYKPLILPLLEVPTFQSEEWLQQLNCEEFFWPSRCRATAAVKYGTVGSSNIKPQNKSCNIL